MHKKIIAGALLTSLFAVGYLDPSHYAFTHKYEIRAASNSLSDQMMLYTYKNFLVDTYESLTLKLPAEYHEEVIRKNINRFQIEGVLETKLQYGKLVMKVGMGLGGRITGDLRKSICDDALDTRFFFYDLFN